MLTFAEALHIQWLFYKNSYECLGIIHRNGLDIYVPVCASMTMTMTMTMK